MYIPINQIDILFIFGHIDVNQNVIKLLNEYDVMIFYFTYSGQFIGIYMPIQKHTGDQIIKHAYFVNDDRKRFLVAKEIIMGSIKNMMFIVKYYQKKQRIDEQCQEHLDIALKKLDKILNIAQIMLIEAEAKKAYYQIFDAIILDNNYRFDERSHYPPKNKVNALMSFGYALLYSRIESSIHRSRLVLELPFIHGHSKANSGLQHDIADLFKPIFVDRLIFQMINKHMVHEDHFETKKGGVYLSKIGMASFIDNFDTFMRKTILVNQKYYSKRQLLSKEVHKISAHVHDDKPYKAFVMTRW